MNARRACDILSGEDRSLTAGTLRLGAAAVEPGYHLAVRCRNWLFDRGWRRVERLPRPVISVGNLTTGGTGKTPMVIDLAQRLLDLGRHPGILLRGYREAEGGSDEATIHQRRFGDRVPVAVNPNRAAGGRLLLDHHPHVDVLLLDDGFQRRQLHRDLDIVLLDASAPWGFGHLLPRGLLREPPASLSRADAVIITHAERVDEASLTSLADEVRAITGRSPAAVTSHVWAGFDRYQVGREEDLVSVGALAESRVMGVCGIGNPEAFAQQLREHAGEVVAMLPYADHHAYTGEQLARLAGRAREAGAVLVTTEKDFVKWQPLLAGRWREADPAIWRPRLRLSYDAAGAAALDALLRGISG